MKKYLAILTIMLFSYGNAFGFIAFNQIMGPNDYRAMIVEAYVPISDKTTINASYAESGYAGQSMRKSYGGSFRTLVGTRVDAGGGFVTSPESGNSKYNAINACAGYTFGRREFKWRVGLYAQNTIYSELQSGNSWRELNQLTLGPSVRATISKVFSVWYNTALFSYSKSVNDFTGSIDSWSLRNDTDLGNLLGIMYNLPSRTETLGVSYRVVKPVEIYAEWSKIYYERALSSDLLTAFGVRYYLTEHFAFSGNLVSYNDDTYTTFGFGLYW